MYVREWIVSHYVGDSPNVTEEARSRIAEFVRKYAPAKSEREAMKNRLFEQNDLKLLDDYSVQVNLTKGDRYLIIPFLDESKGVVPPNIVRENEMLLTSGLWGVGTLVYAPPGDDGPGQVILREFTPFQLASLDLEFFISRRSDFSTEEWIDFIVNSMGFNHQVYSPRQKILLISRLLPMVEPRYNLIELAPKGTGKSFVYENMSRYVAVRSGAITAPVLFYNDARKTPGLITRYDCVVIDEAQKVRGDRSGELTALLKSYLEAGRFGRGSAASITSEAPINLTGNNSVYSYGNVSSTGLVKVFIGNEGNGKFLLKNSILANLEIYGGDFNDSFFIDCPQVCSIFAQNGTNTLLSPERNNVYNITNLNEGILNSEITFQNIQNIKGSIFQDDSFYFSEMGKLDGILDGNGGINSLFAPNSINSWTIALKNMGSIKNVVQFSNIQNLIGGESSDTFTFLNGAEITGIINGKGGNNKLDYSLFTDELLLDLHTRINIQEIIGGLGNNTLFAPEEKNVWYISGRNSGTVGSISFKNFENIVGSDLNENFYILDNGSLDGVLNGGMGENYLHAPDLPNKWFITGVNRGYIENILSFVNVHNLFGGEKEDVFKFLDYSYIAGFVDAKSALNNVLDFSEYSSAVSIDLNKFSNIQNVIGGTNTSLVGKDIENIWDITSENAGSLNDLITFSNITNITGGDKKDVFNLEKDAAFLGNIDSVEGDKSIFSKNRDNYWSINATDSGNINNEFIFTNISNLQGSDGIDIFVFANNSLITGSIDGGLGSNMMDFSAQSEAVTVDLQRIDNVQTITGSHYSDILIGKDNNNIWDFTAVDCGKVGDVKFIGFENIIGGALSDVFVFSDETGVSGFIDGGNVDNVMNILDYSACTTSIKADILTGDASKTLSAINIQAAVLPSLLVDKSLVTLPSSIEIPLSQVAFQTDYMEDGFVQIYGSLPKLTGKSLSFGDANFPIYVSKEGEKTLVYRADSPFIITKSTTKKVFAKATLGPLLSDMKIGDIATRMKNNLKKPINTAKIAIRGEVKQVNTVYEKDSDGMDLDDFSIITSQIKEKSIKQRPRAMHFQSKRVN